MGYEINETHDASLKSFVESAAGSDFPIQNLPFGVFEREEGDNRIGVAIGDEVLDLEACASAGLFDGDNEQEDELIAIACSMGALNFLMFQGPEIWSKIRRRVSELLRVGSEIEQDAELRAHVLVPRDQVRMLLPCEVGDFTDFYASVHHATNVGSMFRPDNPLLPNYKWIPVGYHGRASSVMLSGEDVVRPKGQMIGAEDGPPTFGPCKLLDYEMELGFFAGGPVNEDGEGIAIGDAWAHVFGVCLVNDWSARDIQKWEYQPLGPFLSKSFATSISPWVVTAEALAPFRVPASARPEGDPQPLPHLHDEDDQERGGVGATLEVLLLSAQMREQGMEPMRLSIGSFEHMYWTVQQMLTHHASNGCPIIAGDLMGSGTVSGPEKESRGCLLELTWRGSEPIELPTGEVRKFLADGDEVIMRGWCEREGQPRIGLGECRGRVLPAR